MQNHNKKKGVIRPDKSVEVTSFEGIIPDPETLQALEALYPGATKKFLDLAEMEIVSRKTNENRITWTFKNATILGLVLGFLSSVFVSWIGYQCILLGHPSFGAVIITGASAAVIVAFIYNNKNKS